MFVFSYVIITLFLSILVNMDDRMVEQFVDEDDFIIKIDFDNQLGHFELTLFYWLWIKTPRSYPYMYICSCTVACFIKILHMTIKNGHRVAHRYILYTIIFPWTWIQRCLRIFLDWYAKLSFKIFNVSRKFNVTTQCHFFSNLQRNFGYTEKWS